MKALIEQSEKSKDLFNVMTLLTIVTFIGIYYVITTAIIAEDGVTFIKYAQQLQVAPIKTMGQEFQHPGYPWLIFLLHELTGFLHKNMSILSWIYCGQIVALIFRALTIMILYFLGKQLFGAKTSFWGILILILLPKPAKFGSDVLSDWPHLFFLTTGFLLLVLGAINKKWWHYSFAGAVSGIGYLIRPECAQLVIIGMFWPVLQMLPRKRLMSTGKAALAIGSLFAGFLVTAGPYMKLKGAVFPKKDIWQFELSMANENAYNQNLFHANSIRIRAANFVAGDIAKASVRILNKAGDLLMWVFLPVLLAGMHSTFRKKDWFEPGKFFMAVFIVLNISLMVWLYCTYGYISGRHILPLIALTIFCVPAGLQLCSNWVSTKFAKSKLETSHSQHLWFLIFLIAGLSVCIPKLITPLHAEKRNYRQVAQWLTEHTDESSIIAAPDSRIGFYAQRISLNWTTGQIPAQAQYAVKILKKEDSDAALSEQLGKIVYRYPDEKNSNPTIIIFRQSGE